MTELLAIASLPKEVRTKCKQAKINSKATLLEIARQFDESAMFDYLDRFGGGKAAKRPSAKTEKKNSGVDAKLETSVTGTTFEYESPKANFHLELRFSKPGFSRADILKALKQAFDEVKTNGLGS
ncbi:MAG: hypothetical protein HOP17_07600 [Acidobacteria bacterium]|nr:hypothetical protein [Acidobacteriota bacterium]